MTASSLRGGATFAFGGLRGGLLQFGANLSVAPSEFFRALAIKIQAVLAAIDFERRLIQNILFWRISASSS